MILWIGEIIACEPVHIYMYIMSSDEHWTCVVANWIIYVCIGGAAVWAFELKFTGHSWYSTDLIFSNKKQFSAPVLGTYYNFPSSAICAF